MRFLANIKGGRLFISERLTFDKYISSLKEGYYTVELKPRKKQRSIFQNAYYWGVVVPLVCDGLRDMGNDVQVEETHEFLKGRFCFTEVVCESTGEVLKVPKSTANLSTVDFMAYLSEIQRFASEYLGVVIPEPNEQVSIQF
jgi:hypothetical protein